VTEAISYVDAFERPRTLSRPISDRLSLAAMIIKPYILEAQCGGLCEKVAQNTVGALIVQANRSALLEEFTKKGLYAPESLTDAIHILHDVPLYYYDYTMLRHKIATDFWGKPLIAQTVLRKATSTKYSGIIIEGEGSGLVLAEPEEIAGRGMLISNFFADQPTKNADGTPNRADYFLFHELIPGQACKDYQRELDALTDRYTWWFDAFIGEAPKVLGYPLDPNNFHVTRPQS
jgi:hypothetical protein